MCKSYYIFILDDEYFSCFYCHLLREGGDGCGGGGHDDILYR